MLMISERKREKEREKEAQEPRHGSHGVDVEVSAVLRELFENL